MAENGNGKRQRLERQRGHGRAGTGVVVDVVFPDELPEIYSALKIEIPEAEDRRERCELVCEVQQHLGDDRVRAVAMDATDGLRAATR